MENKSGPEITTNAIIEKFSKASPISIPTFEVEAATASIPISPTISFGKLFKEKQETPKARPKGNGPKQENKLISTNRTK